MEKGKIVQGTIELLIICTHRLLRESLANELSQQACMTMVHCAADTREVIQNPSGFRPDVIITEIASLRRDRLADIQQLRTLYPESKLLIIGLSEFESEFLECIEAGALGCLSLDASLEDLYHHIEVIASGGALCSPQAIKILFTLISNHAGKREEDDALNSTHLTRREREIIALIEEGLSNKEIATYLEIELQTVKNHVHNILEKLQVSNRREAAKYAREKRLMRSLERLPMGRVNGADMR
jgi:DNA-binding NarL/FixJ family response regulator